MGTNVELEQLTREVELMMVYVSVQKKWTSYSVQTQFKMGSQILYQNYSFYVFKIT